jgi:ATP-binding cassette subfamily B protein
MKRLKSYNLPTIFEAIGLMGPRKWVFLASVFGLCAVEIAMILLHTIGTRGAINALTGADWHALLSSVVLIFIAHALWWAAAPFSSYGSAWASKGTVQRLKAELAAHMIRMPMVSHDARPKGELLSLLTNDLDCLQRIYDWYFFQVWHTFLGGIAGLIVIAAMDWRFAIVVFTLGTASVLVTSAYNSKLEKAGAALQEALGKTSADSYELIKGAKTLRLLRLQPYFLSRIFTSSQSEADQKTKTGTVTARMKSVVAAIAALTYAALLVAGALFVNAGLTDWGTVVALTGLKTATDMLFVEFGDFMAGMQTCVAGVKRLRALTDTPAEADDPMQTVIAPSADALTMADVSFSYGDQPVLQGFHMRLPRRGLTVLTGESGAGKSTVMKLLLGLYAPQSGSISFDGTERATLSAIRHKTAYVPQDPLLFRGSVLDNILFGNPDAARTEAVEAARLAGADIFISGLEQGYDTMLADDGKSLSGGQKQRLSIARALVKKAPILLLDEITSALDAETAAQLMVTIRHISKTRAVLLITHDSTIAEQADMVYKI